MYFSRSLVFTALFALLSVPGHAGAATFRVGTGGGCTHATIQAAIDAAAATPDEADFIRITRSVAYDDIALNIHDQHLVLEGGYASCTTDSPDGTRTELSGNGGDSVLRIHGYGDIVLERLTISGGHQPRFDYGYGGGIQISDGPHLVSLSEVLVTGNDAGHGGGISVKNDYSGNPNDVQLLLGDDTVISNNEAGFVPLGGGSLIQGGGIFCNESAIRWTGEGSTSILNNSADYDGGGIGAIECDLTIAPRGAFGSFNGLVLNSAGRDGGGLAVEGPSGGGTRFYTAHADRPVYVAANTAGREGGGIKINSDVKAIAWDLILDGNRSYDEGGAVSVFTGSHVGFLGSGAETFLIMRGTLEGAPAGAVNCNANRRCNRISNNVAADAGGTQQQAAAVRVKATADFNEVAYSAVMLHGTTVQGNSGLNAMRVRVDCEVPSTAEGYADLILDGAALVGNAVNGHLILNTDTPYLCNGLVVIDATTIAGNVIDGPEVIGSTDYFSLYRSIIWQPGKRAVHADGLNAGQVEHLLANDLTGIPDSITNFSADPRFMDLDHGDAHLQASSPAIDYAPASTDSEADDLPRVVDLIMVPNADGFGDQDLGAYEHQAVVNVARNGDFDEDLRIWADVAPAATSWGTEDHAGSSTSGSIEIFDTSTATRVVGLRQCVGIPGPGVYKLGGYSWTHGVRFLPTPDHAILAWNYYPDSADCTGGVSGSGENEAPDDADWRAITPQYIDVAFDEWTPNSSVEIQLIQQKTTNQIGGDSDLVRFDGIALVPDSDVIFADGFD